MLWNTETQFRAVIVNLATPSIEHQRLPSRNTVEEVKMDIDCFFHRCRCPQQPREAGCLRYSKVEPKAAAVGDYIDNDRGFRALTYKI